MLCKFRSPVAAGRARAGPVALVRAPALQWRATGLRVSQGAGWPGRATRSPGAQSRFPLARGRAGRGVRGFLGLGGAPAREAAVGAQ